MVLIAWFCIESFLNTDVSLSILASIVLLSLNTTVLCLCSFISFTVKMVGLPVLCTANCLSNCSLVSILFVASIPVSVSQLGITPSTNVKVKCFKHFQNLWFTIIKHGSHLPYRLYIGINCLCIFIKMKGSPCMKQLFPFHYLS